jgi:hypothetical protein
MVEIRGGMNSEPEVLSLNGYDARDPGIAMGDNGEAVIVWGQYKDIFTRVFESMYR